MIRRVLVVLLMLVMLLGATNVAFATEDLGSWETKADMPTGRSGIGAVVVNEKIYVIGGYNSGCLNTVEEYNPVTDTWTTKANMPTARYDLGVATVDGKIYAIGGDNGSRLSTVEEYDPVTDSWTTKTSMPTARHKMGIQEVNGKIYAIGGYGTSYLSTVEEYNPVTDTWTTKASMPTERNDLGVAEVGGKIYVIGGTNGSYLSTVEEYNLETDTWTTKTSMPTARKSLGVESVNGRIYAMGGYNGLYLRKVQEYNPLTDTWKIMNDIPYMERLNFDAVEMNGKIYAIGGNRPSNNSLGVFTPPVIQLPDEPTNLTATAVDSQVTLFWDEVTDATSYKVKRATSSGGPYTTIASNVTNTSYIDTDVTNGTTYYYVVSVIVLGTESANSNEASVTPQSSVEAPTNLTATAGDSQVTLSWDSVTDATSYTVKRATTSGGPYTTIASGVTNTSYTDTDVTNGTTYYYVVLAVASGTEGADSNEASATPQTTTPPQTGNAIVVITMVNGTEKEYDLTMTKVNNFIDWYDAKENGTGDAYYTIEKDWNTGPFDSRKDYIIFDKICFFEINEY